MLRHVIAVSSIVAGTAIAAEPARMSGQTIKDTITGSLMELDTPLGTKIPVRYSEGGLMSGEAGELASYLGAKTDRGRWWVEDNRLCHRWFRWFDREVQCLRLRREGSRIIWLRDDGRTGTATIAARAEPVVKLSVPAPRAETLRPQMKTEAREPLPLEQSADDEMPIARRESVLGSSVHLASIAAKLLQEPAAAPPVDAKAVPALQAQPGLQPHSDAGASSNAVDPTFRVTGVSAYDILFVRDGPSADYGVVGWINPNGRGIRIVGECQSVWCPIEHRGLGGWVNRYYLASETSDGNAGVRSSQWSQSTALP